MAEITKPVLSQIVQGCSQRQPDKEATKRVFRPECNSAQNAQKQAISIADPASFCHGFCHNIDSHGQHRQHQLLCAAAMRKSGCDRNSQAKDRSRQRIRPGSARNHLCGLCTIVKKDGKASDLNEKYTQKGFLRNECSKRIQEIDQRTFLFVQIQIGNQPMPDPSSDGKETVDIHPVVHRIER